MSDLSAIIAQIREILPKVTPGPWRHHAPDRGYCIDYIVTDAPEAKDASRHSDYIAETGNVSGPRGTNCFEHDAAYIALLNPITVSALLDRIDDLEKAVAYESGDPDAIKGHRALFKRLHAAESRVAEARAEALEEAIRPLERAADIANGRDNLDGFPRQNDEKQRRLAAIYEICTDAALAIRALKSGGANG